MGGERKAWQRDGCGNAIVHLCAFQVCSLLVCDSDLHTSAKHRVDGLTAIHLFLSYTNNF